MISSLWISCVFLVSANEARHFLRNFAFDNKRPSSSFCGLFIVRSLLDCGTRCSMAKTCTSFFYTKTSAECQLHAFLLDYQSYTGPMQDILDTKYYVLGYNDTNDCASTPCMNGGSCTDGINNYTCSCVLGWQGVHCETNTNECASTPCMNGGSCTDNINNYTCSCAPGWQGVQCETKTCPAGYSHTLGASCYEIYANTYLNYIQASTYCNEASGGHLVDITTEDEDTFLKYILMSQGIETYLWIGINDVEEFGVYRWSDGSLAFGGYTNWHLDEPNHDHDDERCGEFISFPGLYKWGDFSCSYTQQFICEYP